MRISIIIPVYNVKKYLPQCLNSILAQSRKVEEIILIDDGSTDGSAKICDEYAARHAAVTVIHQTNQGVAAARNAGLQRCSGDYIAILDADDAIASDYIATYCSYVQKTGCDTCKGTYRRMKQTGKLLPAYHIEPGVYRMDCIYTGLIPRMIGSAPDKKDSIPMGVGVTLYDAGIIREHQLFFPSERKFYSEDMAFNLSYLMYAKHVEVIDYSGYYYRVTDGSSTNRYVEDRFERCMNMYRWEKELAARLGIYELCQYRLTRQMLNHMRSVFHQYKRRICRLTLKESRHELYRICSDPRLQEMIARYPVHKMRFPQRVFVYLIKHRVIWVIQLIYNIAGSN